MQEMHIGSAGMVAAREARQVVYPERSRMGCRDNLYWRGCYAGAFDLIGPEGWSHPAKMSAALCFRILEHLKELGLLKDTDVVLDPMAGTGMTAIVAGAKGYKAVTLELEERFISFEHQNKEYAEKKLRKPLDWAILQGDARKLSELLNGRGLVTVSSPPYMDSDNRGGENKTTEGWSADGKRRGGAINRQGYGATEGQIGNLKDVPLKTVTSPPYGETGTGERGFKVDPRPGRSYKINDDYSKDPANLGNLSDKPLVTVTSPPYDINTVHSGSRILNQDGTFAPITFGSDDYGKTDGNLGNKQSESYLSAMKQVYQEIAKVSDVLAIVLKNPTRGGKLRRLDLDTLSILEQSGWKLYCRHRALLFEELEQANLFGEAKKRVNSRMSFFKRLSWQKGNPVASWEDVLVCVRQ